jgi:hypothetical protein
MLMFSTIIVLFRYFLTILFKNAGAQTQERRLILNFANTLISAGGALIGTSLTDKGGHSMVVDVIMLAKLHASRTTYHVVLGDAC